MSNRIGTHSFARARHTPESGRSYFAGSWEMLEKIVEDNLDLAKKGGPPGSLLVPILDEQYLKMFFSGVVKVTQETELKARFVHRRADEDYYIEVTAVNAPRSPAKAVDIIIYTHESLAKDDDAETGKEYEIVSINARTEEEEPQNPISMARNQLHMKGGSAAEYTAEQFAKAIIYWSTHVMAEENK
jgi:hypothetical protein